MPLKGIVKQTKVNEKQCLILQQKGTYKQSSIQENTVENVGKIFRRAQNPELIGKWNKPDSEILIYGYKKGKDGTENTHELPPPFTDINLYGDIALVCTELDGSIKNFNQNSWSQFIASIMGEDSDTNSESDSFDSENEDEKTIIEEDESDEELDIYEEEEEVVEVPVKRKPKITKKQNKKLPNYYSYTQLNTEPIDSDHNISDNKYRSICMKIINNKLKSLTESEQQKVERGIFNTTIKTCKDRNIWACYENPDFVSMYQIIYRKTITNLDPTSYIGNDGLMARLKDGTYNYQDIASLAPSEMYPEKWRPLIEIQLKREKHLLEGGTEFATDMFRCSRCGKRKCTYYEMQTRSADEPMTVFIKCLVCKKEWKQ